MVSIGSGVLVRVKVAEKGWVIVSEPDAGALKMNPMFRFAIALNGCLSFVDNLFTESAYISWWTRVCLNISP